MLFCCFSCFFCCFWWLGAANFQFGELKVADWSTMRAAQMSGNCMAGGRIATTSLSTFVVCCDDWEVSSSRFDSSMWHASSFSRSLMQCLRRCISRSICSSRSELRAICCRASSSVTSRSGEPCPALSVCGRFSGGSSVPEVSLLLLLDVCSCCSSSSCCFFCCCFSGCAGLLLIASKQAKVAQNQDEKCKGRDQKIFLCSFFFVREKRPKRKVVSE